MLAFPHFETFLSVSLSLSPYLSFTFIWCLGSIISHLKYSWSLECLYETIFQCIQAQIHFDYHCTSLQSRIIVRKEHLHYTSAFPPSLLLVSSSWLQQWLWPTSGAKLKVCFTSHSLIYSSNEHYQITKVKLKPNENAYTLCWELFKMLSFCQVFLFYFLLLVQ